MAQKIVTCFFCSKKNRVPDVIPDGKKLICGSCKVDLVDDDDLDDDDDDDDEGDDDDDDDAPGVARLHPFLSRGHVYPTLGVIVTRERVQSPIGLVSGFAVRQANNNANVGTFAKFSNGWQWRTNGGVTGASLSKPAALVAVTSAHRAEVGQ